MQPACSLDMRTGELPETSGGNILSVDVNVYASEFSQVGSRFKMHFCRSALEVNQCESVHPKNHSV